MSNAEAGLFRMR